MTSPLAPSIGVFGGMGPLASSAFVQAIYGMYRGRLEQETPQVFLYSNPRIEDRTATFLGGRDCAPLLRQLEEGIERLLAQGADQVVICCVTMHYLLPRVAPDLRVRVVSLIDTVFEELALSRGRTLLACTAGSSKLRLFHDHPAWQRFADRMAVLDDREQQELHESMYRVKRDHDIEPLVEVVHRLAMRHRVSAVVAGCTELHLLSPEHGSNALNQQFEIIDPLAAIARRTRRGEYAVQVCA
jgi:aspartate racemase